MPPCSCTKKIDFLSSAHPIGANDSTCATVSFRTTSSVGGAGAGSMPGTGVGVGRRRLVGRRGVARTRTIMTLAFRNSGPSYWRK